VKYLNASTKSKPSAIRSSVTTLRPIDLRTLTLPSSSITRSRSFAPNARKTEVVPNS